MAFLTAAPAACCAAALGRLALPQAQILRMHSFECELKNETWLEGCQSRENTTMSHQFLDISSCVVPFASVEPDVIACNICLLVISLQQSTSLMHPDSHAELPPLEWRPAVFWPCFLAWHNASPILRTTARPAGAAKAPSQKSFWASVTSKQHTPLPAWQFTMVAAEMKGCERYQTLRNEAQRKIDEA